MSPGKLEFKKSLRLYRESLKYFPAGVNSNARAMRTSCPAFTPCTFFIRRAKGSKIWDADGNKYIDYRLGYGPIILGHSHGAVHSAVHKIDEKGLIHAFEHEGTMEAAKKIQRCVPSMEMMRFANSGTEATMSAVRVARAYTKKDKIIKFDGHYHGHHDYVLFSTSHMFRSEQPGYVKTVRTSLGIPKPIDKLVIVEDWNSFEAIEKCVKRHHKSTAAIITEPVMGNASAIMPKEGYLKHLKELCEKYGLLLIFDEVKTGFRVALGGAQQFFHVKPDISTFAKALGNGYPVAVFGGRRDIMQTVGPGKVAHGGTYSANPVSIAAVNAVLDELMKKNALAHVRRSSRKLMRGIDCIFSAHSIPHIVQGAPGMFQLVPTRKRAIHNYRELMFSDKQLFARFQYELLRRGVMLDEDMEEPIYVSYSHSRKDLDSTLAAFEDSVRDALVPRTSLRRAAA
ncbi:MAG: glutamate-1-semialdehyde 2,1-aminomutase [Candidatus Aenigmarchaeota archaeon]|nr:glutamate-1-semialdehyde 2,1-aminomutase [Candidatus Aenigmarchaeota archaeon]